jgi:hypothetical protein
MLEFQPQRQSVVNQLQVIIRQPNIHADRLQTTIDVLAKDGRVVTNESIVEVVALFFQILHHII